MLDPSDLYGHSTDTSFFRWMLKSWIHHALTAVEDLAAAAIHRMPQQNQARQT